jgi:hypothetical protein
MIKPRDEMQKASSRPSDRHLAGLYIGRAGKSAQCRDGSPPPPDGIRIFAFSFGFVKTLVSVLSNLRLSAFICGKKIGTPSRNSHTTFPLRCLCFLL